LTLLAESRTPLASYLAAVLRAVRPLPPLDLELNQAYGNVLAEDVRAPGPLPAFDHAVVDGYAARLDDLLDASSHRPVRLNVIGDLVASSWRPVRLTPGTCFSIAAGAALPGLSSTLALQGRSAPWVGSQQALPCRRLWAASFSTTAWANAS